jgi:hypothetical protein
MSDTEKQTTTEKIQTNTGGGFLRAYGIWIGAAFVIGLALGYFITPQATSSPTEMVRQIDTALARTAPGEDGPMLVSVGEDELTRKVFDLQLNLYLQQFQAARSQEEIMRAKNNPTFLQGFLEQLIQTRVVLKAMESDPDFQGNPELLTFMSLTLADGIPKYYLFKKSANLSVSTNVTDAEIEQAYNMVRRDPQAAANIDRLPFDEIKRYLSQEIVRQRQTQEVNEHLKKVRDKLSIVRLDEPFGKITPADSENPEQSLIPLGQ